ncbi:hypothetical protein [Paenibacillus sp. Marseille-Q4541]|uniref:hypothetical protein n=1 Tax=Paenibacillus sp. Marseille-Q4541 TaxID=2831522 RepID=UPI001BA83666|nr:hypothetical protein [Paenibacillus sp. Marseille-Q4541]
MKQKNRFLKVLTVLVLFWLAFYCYYSFQGYVLTEQKALNSLLRGKEAQIVYKKKVDEEHTLLMLQEGQYEEAIHISTRLGMWYRVDGSMSLSKRPPEDSMDYTWSASTNPNGNYDLMVAVKIMDPKITRVVVSNDGTYEFGIDPEENLDDIMFLSSVHMDLELEDGYGIAYREIPINESTAMVFRGLDKDGNMISRLW